MAYPELGNCNWTKVNIYSFSLKILAQVGLIDIFILNIFLRLKLEGGMYCIMKNDMSCLYRGKTENYQVFHLKNQGEYVKIYSK